MQIQPDSLPVLYAMQELKDTCFFMSEALVDA